MTLKLAVLVHSDPLEQLTSIQGSTCTCTDFENTSDFAYSGRLNCTRKISFYPDEGITFKANARKVWKGENWPQLWGPLVS